MSDWIPVHAALFEHIKTYASAEQLQISPERFALHLIRLWLWAISSVDEHGEITGMPHSLIAMKAGYDGDAELFWTALTMNGHGTSPWIDERKGRLYLHDWPEYGGRMKVTRRKNAERMRNIRREQDKPSRAPKKLTPKKEKHIGCPDVLKGLPLYEADHSLCEKLPGLLPTWKEAFPGVDIVSEIKKAHAWEMANPTKKKVQRARFLNNWLGRAQDKGGRNESGTPRTTRRFEQAEQGKFDDDL